MIMEELRKRRILENLEELKRMTDIQPSKEERIKEIYGIKPKRIVQRGKNAHSNCRPQMQRKANSKMEKEIKISRKTSFSFDFSESDSNQSSSGDEWTPTSHSSPLPKAKLGKRVHKNTRIISQPAEKRDKCSTGTLMETAISEIGRRYPFRENRPLKYSTNVNIPEDDRYLYCYECESSVLGGCIQHPVEWIDNKPLKVCENVKNKFVYFQTEKCVCGMQYYLHSAQTAPIEWVIVARSKIPGAGFGVWTRTSIKRGTTFGPYTGDIVYLETVDEAEYTRRSRGGYAWLVRGNVDGIKSHLVDARNPLCSNWLRFVNCARCEEEQNLVTVQYRGKIYYRACQDIRSGEELLTFYGSEFASEIESIQVEQMSMLPNTQSGISATFGKTTTQIPAIQKPRTKADSGEKTDPCEICGKVFTRADSLRKHMSTAHMGEKTDPCEICGKVFTQASDLRKHMSTVHMGEKTDPCEICGKIFTEAGNLRKHISTVHMGEKTDPCEICGKIFTCAGSLRRHMSTVHIDHSKQFKLPDAQR